MKLTSQILSWVFVPLFTPVLGLMLVMFIPNEQDFLFNENCLYALTSDQKWKLLYGYFFFSMLVPGLAMVYLKSIGLISTIEVDNRKERSIPILIMFGSILGLYILYQFLPANVVVPKYIFSYPLSGVVATGVFFFLTFWRKVSLHGGGIGIMTGFLIAYMTEMTIFPIWIIVFAIIASGFVMSARIYLEKHTLLEVTVGWFTGTFVTFAVNYWY